MNIPSKFSTVNLHTPLSSTITGNDTLNSIATTFNTAWTQKTWQQDENARNTILQTGKDFIRQAIPLLNSDQKPNPKVALEILERTFLATRNKTEDLHSYSDLLALSEQYQDAISSEDTLNKAKFEQLTTAILQTTLKDLNEYIQISIGAYELRKNAGKSADKDDVNNILLASQALQLLSALQIRYQACDPKNLAQDYEDISETRLQIKADLEKQVVSEEKAELLAKLDQTLTNLLKIDQDTFAINA